MRSISKGAETNRSASAKGEILPPLVKHEFGLSEQYKTPDSLPMNWLN
jgi:hypothetical protein